MHAASQPPSAPDTHRAAAIADLYDRHLRHRPADDAFATSGRDAFMAAIAPFMAAGRPIELLLPGFAHKNPNPQKTLGPLPDLAELMSIRHLEAFGAAVSAIYRPAGHGTGCRITVFADGRVWGDLLGVDRATQLVYAGGVRAMTSSPHVAFADLGDLMAEPSADAMEARWQSPDAIARLDAALADPSSRPHGVFQRFIGLVKQDRVWPPDAAPDDVERIARAAARRMMIRHAAFTAALAEAYSEHVRLTVHPGRDSGPKFSVRFSMRIPHSGDAPLLAYHCVAVEAADGSDPRLMTRAEAMALPGGCHLIETTDGRPWCLRRNT